MTSISNLFKTYQKVDGREVTMGNEVSCLIVDIGYVRIIMFDDSYQNPDFDIGFNDLTIQK